MNKTTYIIMEMTGTNSCVAIYNTSNYRKAITELDVLTKGKATFALVKAVGDTYSWVELTETVE